jgi:hypothetical protein
VDTLGGSGGRWFDSIIVNVQSMDLDDRWTESSFTFELRECQRSGGLAAYLWLNMSQEHENADEGEEAAGIALLP